MSVEEVRRRATEFDRKVERWSQVGTLTVALLIVKNVWEVWVDTDMLERAGDCLMLLALLYRRVPVLATLHGPRSFPRHWGWRAASSTTGRGWCASASSPATAGNSSCRSRRASD